MGIRLGFIGNYPWERPLIGVRALGWEGISDPAEREAARQQVLRGYLPNNPPALEQQRRDRIERQRIQSRSPFIQEQAAEAQRPSYFEPGEEVHVSGYGDTPFTVRRRTIDVDEGVVVKVEYEVVQQGRTYPLTLVVPHAILSYIGTQTEETQTMKFSVGSRVLIREGTEFHPDFYAYSERFFLRHVATNKQVGTVVEVDPADPAYTYRVQFSDDDDEGTWLSAESMTLAQLEVGSFVVIDQGRLNEIYGEDAMPARRTLINRQVIGIITERDQSAIPYRVRWDFDGAYSPGWIRDVLVPADLSPLPEQSVVVVARISPRRAGGDSYGLKALQGERGIVVTTDNTNRNTCVEFASGDHFWFYREELYLAEPLGVEMDQRVILTGSGLEKAVEQVPDKADFFNEVYARALSGLVFDVSPIRGTFMACFKSQRGSAGCHHISLSKGEFKIAPESAVPANGDQDPVEDASSLPVGTRVRPNASGVARLSACSASSAHEIARGRLVGVISEIIDNDGDYEVMWDQVEDYWWLKPSELEVVSDRTPEHQAAVDAYLAATQAIVDAVDAKARMGELLALSNTQYAARNDLMRYAVRS